MLTGDGNNKNLKDINSPLPILPLNKGEDLGGGLSYKKINKLITALYMVTDMIDKDEPIRKKLRTLGAEIISDMSNEKLARTVLASHIGEVMSFIDVASAMNFISEMNSNILKNEFNLLKESIHELIIKPAWFEEIFSKDNQSIGHDKLPHQQNVRTRIGVQKGSTLMKALSDRTLAGSKKVTSMSNRNIGVSHGNNFELLKNERRFEIIKSIKNNEGNATITEIKNKAQGQLITCSEKTLQRELMSMIKDGVLNKTGEKRWSRYSVKN